MKFIIEMVAMTNDSDKYRIMGYLHAEDSEKELLAEMIDAMEVVLDKMQYLKDFIIIKSGTIIYSNIALEPCISSIKLIGETLDFKIDIELAHKVKYVPEMAELLFKFELARMIS